MVAAGPREVLQPPRVAKEVAGLKEEEGEKKERVMALEVVLFGGGCGF